jgi:GT2 family glycosyltransferase
MTHCSVLIVNWNSWKLLSRCLEALSEQTYQDFKIFVADNASDEPPPKGIFSILPEVDFIQNDRNYGFAAANNRLLKLPLESEWVALLNPDAFPEPEWLEQLINASEEHPEYSFFSSRQIAADNPEILDGDGDVYHISGLPWRDGHGKPVTEHSTPWEVFSPCAAAAMYRKDAFLEAGGFDEDYFCYIEDVDLGFRLRLVGHKAMHVPDAVVHHLGSATTGGQRSDFSMYHGHRNLVWTFIKNMPGVLFWALLPIHVVLNIVAVARFAMRGQTMVILRAKLDAIKGIPRMWRKRREIQSHRRATVMDIWRVLDKRLIPIRGGKSSLLPKEI